ncbi:MAG: hypothetical protein K0B06_05735 [Brevefilum sp.]|nr:hypothetical protein [Brevefilum sp.]
MLANVLQATRLVADVFEKLGVRYVVCGSLASSAHGMVRTTMDADLIADLRQEHISMFVEMLKDTFYIDDEMIRSAIEHRRSFNIIHLESMFKVDIFTPKQRQFDENQLSRRQETPLGEGQISLFILSPEDIILAKLEWYRLGGEVSDQQWRDILGVLIIKQNQLDHQYMQQMADQMDTDDLLKRALQEAYPEIDPLLS